MKFASAQRVPARFRKDAALAVPLRNAPFADHFSLFVAYIFWRKRNELPEAGTGAQPPALSTLS
jgi:hypothetical protein